MPQRAELKTKGIYTVTTAVKSKPLVNETVRSCTTNCSQCLLPAPLCKWYVMATDMPVRHTSKFGCPPFSKDLITSFSGSTDKERARWLGYAI